MDEYRSVIILRGIGQRLFVAMAFGEKIGMAAAVVSGILILGSFGFVFGFFGLMFVMRDVQQATAIGILIASPLGMLLGGVSGYILASRQNS